MLHELAEDAVGLVVPLFAAGPPTYAQLIIRAVAVGNAPGRVWVDEAQEPRSAFVWDTAQCYDLAGAADNPAFNAALGQLIREQIAPDAVARGFGQIKVRTTVPEWEAAIPDLFQATLTQRMRLLYTFAGPRIADWAARLPPGFALVPIDAALLAQPGLVNRDRVREEIACCWTEPALFFARGLGIAAIHENTIVGWCTGEYASGHDIGIGIETIAAYQGRGLATLTAAAFVARCQERGLGPYWSCWAHNAPSRAVAEKVGFIATREYPAYVGTLR